MDRSGEHRGAPDTEAGSGGSLGRASRWLFARRADPVRSSPDASAPAPAAPRKSSSWGRTLRSLLIVVVLVVGGGYLLRSFVVETYFIPSASMEPTLHGCPGCNDDRVLVEKLSYDFHGPRPEDVVVFDRPATWTRVAPSEKVLIKRVIGVGGDRIVIRGGHVYRDGQELDEPYVNPACGQGTLNTSGTTSRQVYRVPAGSVFVMGDNRCDSDDSRFNGPLPVSDVIGKAFLIVWPLKRIHSL